VSGRPLAIGFAASAPAPSRSPFKVGTIPPALATSKFPLWDLLSGARVSAVGAAFAASVPVAPFESESELRSP
jgi:hypothetical protein